MAGTASADVPLQPSQPVAGQPTATDIDWWHHDHDRDHWRDRHDHDWRWHHDNDWWNQYVPDGVPDGAFGSS
ncbi:hypothetical protein [Nocardia sp. NPDC020380]|uniref:hypothetical protein n=1 Tax=Nocardia sp. NPDC020380 TaxID=3364309 RepID=UPI0037A30F37